MSRVMDDGLVGSELLEGWHSHRTAIIVVAVLAIALLRYWSIWRTRPAVAKPFGESKEQQQEVPFVYTVEAEKSKLRDIDHLQDTPVVSSKDARPRLPPKRITGLKRTKSSAPANSSDVNEVIQPLVFYFSLGGTTRAFAEKLCKELESHAPPESTTAQYCKPILHDLTELDYDDFFINPPKNTSGGPTRFFYLLLLPSYDIDSELSNFLEHLTETHNDFRIDTAPLSSLAGYCVFGLGDKEGWPTEASGFCSQAKEADKWMARLTGGKRAFPLGMGDVKTSAISQLEEWGAGARNVLEDLAAGQGLGDGVAGSGDPAESDEEEEASDAETSLPEGAGALKVNKANKKTSDADMEDLGGLSKGASEGPLAIDFTTYGTTKSKPAVQAPKEMVPKSSPTYTSLTKQGYTIVGSHSGVKICRWTKSALRGRGSCYKFSFYGIKSHLCMETTPSLSCSNKCVFCWRHGTNPVGTTWRWQVDPPEMIFAGVKEGHYKKIKMMKGVPGVRAERFAEAMRIRHCALSLVGEPIFYPHINEFTAMLHNEHISSFLVCNAQHPDQLATLKPVTQLYVSIDASNKESLRKIDRPLHRDFWERFCRCLDILREKRYRQRTVFRLTLVKGFNIDEEAEGYADLVERALPGFVEIKGVTYCGTSTSSAAGLTMQNVPFYEEVCEFVEALAAALKKRGLDYGLAAEHAHSCCVLIADKTRFYKEDGWHTLIDYEKFFTCLESGEEFAPEDYIGEKTPEWSLYGNGGFDPRDERVDRKGRPKEGVLKVGGGKVIEI